MDGLAENAKEAYKFKNMQEPLALIHVLCDNRCELTFTKPHVQVSIWVCSILKGYREQATSLWRFPNVSKPQSSMPKGEQLINTV